MTTQAVEFEKQLLDDAADALKVCKIQLMMKKATTFYTAILFSLKQSFTGEIPTAATDGRHLLMNPKFFWDLSPNGRIFLIAHEVLHVALDHMHRRGDRDPFIWNMAGDYVINAALIRAEYKDMPEGGLYDSKYDGKTTEEVYDILYKKSDQAKQQLKDACAGTWNGNDVQYPENAAPGQAVPQDEVTATILKATTQAQAMGMPPGSVPAEIDITLQRTLNPPLPWNVILQNYLTEYAKDDYSFRKPNRRFMPDHYMPCAYSEAMGELAVLVDASGSVTDYQFNTFITKIDEIQRMLKPRKITVVAFDTKIKSVQYLHEDEDAFRKLEFHGRGGTSIVPVQHWLGENKPTVAVVFTDGEFRWHDPNDPNVPVIWVVHDNPKWKAKHGRTIIYDIGREPS